MNYGYIYKTTFLKKNLIYVGQHVAQEFDPKYIGSGKKLLNTIKAHGRYDAKGNPNFSCEVLDWADNPDTLNNLEIYWIDKLDARNPLIGLNIAYGGTDFRNGHTTETRKAISDAQLGGIFVYKDNRLKRVASVEEAEHLYKDGWVQGRIGGRARKVICLETMEIWQAVNHLAKSLNFPAGALQHYLDNWSYNGLHYCYLNTYLAWSDSEREAFLRHETIDPRKAVLCVELNKCFASIKEAHVATGISRVQISRVCRGDRGFRTAGGYHWKYLDEESALIAEQRIMVRPKRAKGDQRPARKRVYCIIDGEIKHFHNKTEAAEWWIANYPIGGKDFSLANYRVKIQQSIEGKPIRIGKNQNACEKITNIKWFLEK